MAAPKSLAPVILGGNIKADHINSTNTMGIQSIRTNDNTVLINPSQSHLNKNMDIEDSYIKEDW